jgi:hypothetical protein
METVRLGSLGLMEYFKLPGEEIVYRTITYAPSNVNHTQGDRWCLNMETLKAMWMFCRERVVKVGGT